jgi:hypothetical protein
MFGVGALVRGILGLRGCGRPLGVYDTTAITEKPRLDKRLGLNEAARGNDRLTQWRRHFEAALAEAPILDSNHKEYTRHLREARAQEARIREDRCPIG